MSILQVNQASIDQKEMAEEKSRDLRKKKDAPKFKYEFINMEQPGKSLSFFYGDARRPQKIHWKHGEVVECTEEIAEHVQSRQTPIWEWVQIIAPNGVPSKVGKIVGYTPRFFMKKVKG